jgi:hypothetical protein
MWQPRGWPISSQGLVKHAGMCRRSFGVLRRQCRRSFGLSFSQENRRGAGRPDMRGISADGGSPLLIESKIWAGLTSHQPSSYLERLPGPGVLLFVVPESRLQSMSQEIDVRVSASGEPATTWSTDASIGALRWRITDGGKAVAIISWQRLIEEIRKAVAGETGCEVSLSDVDQLRGFIDAACGMAETFQPLLPEHVSGREVPELLASIRIAVDRAVECAIRDLGFRRTKSDDKFDAHGVEFEFNGVAFWFGYYRVAWRQFGATPVWLEVWQRNQKAAAVLDALATLAGGRANILELPNVENWYVPVPLPVQEHEDVVVKGIGRFLQRAQHLLGAL